MAETISSDIAEKAERNKEIAHKVYELLKNEKASIMDAKNILDTVKREINAAMYRVKLD